ncbi:MAG: zinc-dependent metalloprotease, partial [Chitinophagales bacterium]|nr:zinc-dependent metalloprotease [Chitinophagales bacterium]
FLPRFYFVDDPAGYCGYFAYSPDALTVANSCSMPGSTTLAHELGHYFSLPHPFDKVNNISEFVDGSNCTVGGDLFCDTPADFLNYRWECPYNGDSTDQHGDQYDPDETLFMSYSSDHCANRFSAEETDAMINNLVFERGNLLDHPVPSTALITELPTLILPIDSADNVSNTFAEFSWSAVPNATFYNLQATKYYNFGYPLQLNVIVKGTAFTTWIEPNENWVWRVLPLNEGYTCGVYSGTGHFSSVQGTGLLTLPNATDQFSIYPSLISKGNSFSIVAEIDSGNPLHVEVYNVEGRKIIETERNVNAGSNVLSINASTLNAGLYLVNITINGISFQQKIIIAD